MRYQMQVTFMGTYVEARSVGEKNYQTAEQLWAEITRICQEQNCYRVLGIADSDKQMSVMDSINHEQLFRQYNITPKYKIAWAESNPEELDKLKILETILVNRGYRGKIFADAEQAKAWLLKDVSEL